MVGDNLRSDFYDLIDNYPTAKYLIDRLTEKGKKLLLVGSIRTYFENRFNSIPRDFDIVVKTNYKYHNIGNCFSNLQYEKNRYGGYKINVEGLQFDIWI